MGRQQLRFKVYCHERAKLHAIRNCPKNEISGSPRRGAFSALTHQVGLLTFAAYDHNHFEHRVGVLGSEVWSESKLQDAKKASTCDNSRADEHHLIYAHVRSLGCAKKCRPRGLSKAFSPVVSAPWDCCTLGNDKQRSLFQRLPTVGSKSFLSLCALFVPLCAYRSLYRSLSLSLFACFALEDGASAISVPRAFEHPYC